MLRNKLLIVSIIALSLTGCSSWDFRPTKTVVAKPIRVPLALSMPQPLQLTPPNWIVITPSNAAKVWQQLENDKNDVVLIGVTDDGYERMAVDLATVRALIAEQRAIILEYRKYYESQK